MGCCNNLIWVKVDTKSYTARTVKSVLNEVFKVTIFTGIRSNFRRDALRNEIVVHLHLHERDEIVSRLEKAFASYQDSAIGSAS